MDRSLSPSSSTLTVNKAVKEKSNSEQRKHRRIAEEILLAPAKQRSASGLGDPRAHQRQHREEHRGSPKRDHDPECSFRTQPDDRIFLDRLLLAACPEDSERVQLDT